SKESAHRNDASHAHRLDARTTGRLGSAERMSKLGEPVVPASLIGGGEMGVCTAWAWDQKAVRCADAQRLHTKRRRSGGRVQRAHDVPIAGNAMKASDARSMALEFSHKIGHARGKFGERQFARARTGALGHIGETEAM